MNQYYGLKSGEITRQEKEHSEIVREIAARGMVLLENKEGLPLQVGEKIALYGYGARNTVLCGLGAASFTSREEVSIEEGLERAGIIVTSKDYLERYSTQIKQEEDVYYKNIREASEGVLIKGVIKMYEEPLVPSGQPLITDEDIRQAGTDTAVYVISRVSGEGADRKVREGDYLLAEEEKENLRILSRNFNRLIVLLNVGGPLDTSYIRSLSKLSALLIVGQAGGVTGLAAADVLTGKITPEGKLADTWAETYEDYPNAASFAAMNGNLDDEMYAEGIYVGYRYFDSFDVAPAYPFGYGLSYTDFQIDINKVVKSGGQLCVEAEVMNKGREFAGREVVQAYVSAPAGKLEKPYQELKGFEKTGILHPGETQTVSIKIDINSLASYSEKDSAWILESGDYLVRVGNSSRNTVVAAIMRIEETIVCEQCRKMFALDCEMDEMSPAHAEPVTELAARAEKDGVCVICVDKRDISCTINHYRKEMRPQSNRVEETVWGNEALRYEDVLEGRVSLNDFVDSLTAEEMSVLCVGNAGDEEASIVCAGSGTADMDAVVPMVPGTCDSTRELIVSRGIPNMHMSDGGSGLRLLSEYELDRDGNLLTHGLFSVRGVDKILGKDYIGDRANNQVFQQYTTGLPIAAMLAQTWDRELCRKCGEIEGKEMQDFHVELWLAPSMNIHRNPLCGRNFEYYSEDPLITGECAAAVIKAIQSYRHTGVTVKHFACNNQEDNRHGSNAHVSERALREIYLKGFEIAVKKAHPAAIMSSYNLINGIHSANNYELLTSVARDEWGFDGIVMTDWGATSSEDDGKRKYKSSTCAGCMHAGNDLIMPGSRQDIRNLMASVKEGEVTVQELRLCAKRILRTMIKLNAERH